MAKTNDTGHGIAAPALELTGLQKLGRAGVHAQLERALAVTIAAQALIADMPEKERGDLVSLRRLLEVVEDELSDWEHLARLCGDSPVIYEKEFQGMQRKLVELYLPAKQAAPHA